MSKRKLNIRRQEFKDKVLIILENRIDEQSIEAINNCKSKNAVRRIICELTEQHHNLLRENGIKEHLLKDLIAKTKSL